MKILFDTANKKMMISVKTSGLSQPSSFCCLSLQILEMDLSWRNLISCFCWWRRIVTIFHNLSCKFYPRIQHWHLDKILKREVKIKILVILWSTLQNAKRTVMGSIGPLVRQKKLSFYMCSLLEDWLLNVLYVFKPVKKRTLDTGEKYS